MREVWDVYTKDRRRTGKTCLRGEQGTLEEDEFHMWVMVWIKMPGLENAKHRSVQLTKTRIL